MVSLSSSEFDSRGFKYSWSQESLGDFYTCDMRRGDLGSVNEVRRCKRSGGARPPLNRVCCLVEGGLETAWGHYYLSLEAEY